MGAVLRAAAGRGLKRPLAAARGRVAASLRASPRVGGLPRDFWLLFVGTFVNRAGTFVVPFLALYVTRGRGHDASVAGAVLLAYGVAGLPSQPLGGTLADVAGRVRTGAGALLASAAALIGLGVAHTPLQLMIAAAALGFVADMYRPATAALIADIIPTRDRPRAFGLQFWAVNLGFAGAATIGGFLAEISWTWLFIGDAVTTAAYGLIVLRLVHEPDRVAGTEQPGVWRSVGLVARDRLFVAFMAVALIYALMYSQTQSTLSLEVVSHGLSERDFGLILALNGIVIVLVQPLVIGRAARWSPGTALAGAVAVLGLGLGATAFASTVTTFGLTVVVWTLGEIVGSTFAAPIVADLSPPGLRGRYQGWFGLAFSVAFAVGPAVGVRAFGSFGGAAVWASCAVAGILAALLTLRLRDGIAQRREAAAG